VTCDEGTWSGSTPITYTYQWLLDKVAIPGETNPTYDVVVGDVGHKLRCRVTAHNVAGQASKASDQVLVTP
jgi:hypothetical protein